MKDATSNNSLGMSKYIFCNGAGRFSEYIIKNVNQFKIRNRKKDLIRILFTNNHTSEFKTVTNQITEMLDVSREDKRKFDYVTYAKVTNPFGILAVSLIALL